MKTLYRMIVSLLISVGTFVALIVYIGVGKVTGALFSVQTPILLLPVILISPAVQTLRALRWKFFLGKLMNTAPSVPNLFLWTAFGDLVNWFMPVGIEGDIAKAKLFSMQGKNGFAPILSTVGIERVLDAAVVASLAFVAASFMTFHLERQVILTLALMLGFGVVVILSVYLSGYKPVIVLSMLNKVTSFMPNSLQTRVMSFASGVTDAAVVFVKLRWSALIFLGYTFIIWFLPVAANFMIFASMNVPLLLPAIVIGSVLMAFSAITPAPPLSAGSFEIIWAIIFTMLGVNLDKAIASGIIAHFMIIVYVIPFGFLATSWLGLSTTDVMSFGIKSPKQQHPTVAPNIL